MNSKSGPPFPRRVAPLVAAILVGLGGCDGSETEAHDAEASQADIEAATPAEAPDAPPLLRATDTFQLGRPIRSIALWRHPTIPFRSAIIVAHGDAGLSILAFDGGELWRSDQPSDIVSVTGDDVRIFHQGADGSSTLRAFTMIGDGTGLDPAGPAESPSPIAPTTLLRTNIADLGSAAIREGALVGPTGARGTLDHDAATFAASAANFGEIYRRGVLAMGGESGALRLYPLSAVAPVLAVTLPDQEGPRRGERLSNGEESAGE